MPGPLANFAMFAARVARRFLRDECPTRAAALAYVSLLSLVPFFAVMFAVLKGLGLPARLEPWLLERMGLAGETVKVLVTAIERANVGLLGAVGVSLLIVSVFGVFGTIEHALNRVWRVPTARSHVRRVADYSALIFIAPFLLLLAVGVISSLRITPLLRTAEHLPALSWLSWLILHVLSILANIIGLGIVFAVLPNRRMPWESVAIAAVVSGLLWLGVQWIYVSLQVGLASYSALYGALAQVPLTLIWLYASWTVFLLGAEVAATWELGGNEKGTLHTQAVALQLLRSVWLAFQTGEPPLNLRAWSKRYGVPYDVAAELSALLREWGWIRAVDSGNSEGLVPGSHPSAWAWCQCFKLEDQGNLPQRLDPVVRAWAERALERRKNEWARFWGSPEANPLFPVSRVGPPEDAGRAKDETAGPSLPHSG